MTENILNIFSSFQNYLKGEQLVSEEISNIVKLLEPAAHEIVTVLQAIHQDGSHSGIKECCDKAHQIIEKDVRLAYKKLNDLLEGLHKTQYYKYHDHWMYVTQQLVFVISLITFLEHGTLVSHEGVAEILSVNHTRGKGFHLDLVDYLMGILHLASELSRFAVNSVTFGDYKRPMEISKFLTELNAGFTLLNLKNDNLRKRFDGLKYEIKKVEEVVYDLSVRGLK